jgi:hypothetical protein
MDKNELYSTIFFIVILISIFVMFFYFLYNFENNSMVINYIDVKLDNTVVSIYDVDYTWGDNIILKDGTCLGNYLENEFVINYIKKSDIKE